MKLIAVVMGLALTRAEAMVGLAFAGIVIAALVLRSCRPSSASSLRKSGPISIRMLPLGSAKDYDV